VTVTPTGSGKPATASRVVRAVYAVQHAAGRHSDGGTTRPRTACFPRATGTGASMCNVRSGVLARVACATNASIDRVYVAGVAVSRSSQSTMNPPRTPGLHRESRNSSRRVLVVVRWGLIDDYRCGVSAV